MKLSTAISYFGKLKTLYRHFRIEIHDLPAINIKGVNISKQVTYDELLTKDEIKEILKVTNPYTGSSCYSC